MTYPSAGTFPAVDPAVGFAPLQVDAVGWCINRLRDGSFAVGSETPGNLEARLPFVRVTRAGGLDDGLLVDSPRMVFDAFGTDRQAANRLAYSIAPFLRALIGVVVDGATLSRVDMASGPSGAPWDNPEVRRSVAIAQLRLFAAQ